MQAPTSQRVLSRLQRALTPRRAARVVPASPAEGESIVVRDRRFNLNADGCPPRFWHGAGPAVSIFFDNLSIFFPLGERFFMRSVKALQDRAPEGSELRAAVRAFHAQEAYHGREHRAYNAHLGKLGYPVEALEANVGRILERVTRHTPKHFHLAVTTALEHFTAFMGHELLAEPALLEGSDPTMAALWRWHAVEETEHKAVAFDLYMAAGGTKAMLNRAIVLASITFWVRVAIQQVRMMRAAGIASDLGQWRALLRYLFVSPGNLAGMPAAIVDFLRPDFHPNDTDSSAVVAAWREAAGEGPAAATA